MTTVYLVMELVSWGKLPFKGPIGVTLAGPLGCVGWLGVFTTREHAERAFPGKAIQEVSLVNTPPVATSDVPTSDVEEPIWPSPQ